MKIKLPVLPNLTDTEAHLLVELIDGLIEALTELQSGLRRAYPLDDTAADASGWTDEIHF